MLLIKIFPCMHNLVLNLTDSQPTRAQAGADQSNQRENRKCGREICTPIRLLHAKIQDKQNMIHRASCVHNYSTTDEVFTVRCRSHCGSIWTQGCSLVSGKMTRLRGPRVVERASAQTRQMSGHYKIVLGEIGPETYT